MVSAHRGTHVEEAAGRCGRKSADPGGEVKWTPSERGPCVQALDGLAQLLLS